MKPVASFPSGAGPEVAGCLPGLGKALAGCIVWLQLGGRPVSDCTGRTGHRPGRPICPYEGACTEHGRCFLPHRPRC